MNIGSIMYHRNPWIRRAVLAVLASPFLAIVVGVVLQDRAIAYGAFVPLFGFGFVFVQWRDEIREARRELHDYQFMETYRRKQGGLDSNVARRDRRYASRHAYGMFPRKK